MVIKIKDTFRNIDYRIDLDNVGDSDDLRVGLINALRIDGYEDDFISDVFSGTDDVDDEVEDKKDDDASGWTEDDNRCLHDMMEHLEFSKDKVEKDSDSFEKACNDFEQRIKDRSDLSQEWDGDCSTGGLTDSSTGGLTDSSGCCTTTTDNICGHTGYCSSKVIGGGSSTTSWDPDMLDFDNE
jgi:hypothetical protein